MGFGRISLYSCKETELPFMHREMFWSFRQTSNCPYSTWDPVPCRLLSPAFTQTDSVACVAILTTRQKMTLRSQTGHWCRTQHILGQSVCDEPTLPRVCTDAEEQKYASEVYCGMLTSRQGPFSTCSSVLNAHSFFRSCMFDMCTTHRDPAALCDAIEAFSATCDKVGISVLAWRNTTFCRMYLTFLKMIYKQNILVINSTVLIDKECITVIHPQWKSMRPSFGHDLCS